MSRADRFSFEEITPVVTLYKQMAMLPDALFVQVNSFTCLNDLQLIETLTKYIVLHLLLARNRIKKLVFLN